jgi:hypothetical protein
VVLVENLKAFRNKIKIIVDYFRFFYCLTIKLIVKMGFQWCDCKIIRVVPPTLEEMEKDAQEEKESEEKESPSKSKKAKKSFSPLEHLFKYELEEVDLDEGEVAQVKFGCSYLNDFESSHFKTYQLFTHFHFFY